MKCKLDEKRGNLNGSLNRELGNGRGYTYTHVLTFAFLGINDIKYTLKMYNSL